MTDVFADAAAFNREIIGIAGAYVPTALTPARRQAIAEHIREEAQELIEAAAIEDQIDALMDLIYVAAGKFLEMGIDPQLHWQAVHDANMKRVRGNNPSKRPGMVGFDAVKPDGWTEPDHRGILEAQFEPEDDGFITLPDSLRSMSPNPKQLMRPGKPKVLILGHARHGKDTMAEILRDLLGFRFQSSSMFACERIIMPFFDKAGAGYSSPQACYEDRTSKENRKLWFDLISDYGEGDRARLARELLSENDIYVGMRNIDEYNACMAEGLFDAVFWVDALHRGLPPEDPGSFNIPYDENTMIYVNNNGDENDLVMHSVQAVAPFLSASISMKG